MFLLVVNTKKISNNNNDIQSRQIENPGSVFPTISLPTFYFSSNMQNRKLGRRKLGKKVFRHFRHVLDFELPLFKIS